MSFSINREFGRDANKINKNNDGVGWREPSHKTIRRCKEWSGITIEWRKPRVCPWKRNDDDERGIVVFARSSCKPASTGSTEEGLEIKSTRLLWRERRTVLEGHGCFETTHVHRCSLAVARGAVSIGRAVLGNVWGVGNGDRTSYKDNDYSDDDSSGSSRHKTRKQETTMMTAATTHAQKQLHTHTCV